MASSRIAIYALLLCAVSFGFATSARALVAAKISAGDFLKFYPACALK